MHIFADFERNSSSLHFPFFFKLSKISSNFSLERRSTGALEDEEANVSSSRRTKIIPCINKVSFLEGEQGEKNPIGKTLEHSV